MINVVCKVLIFSVMAKNDRFMVKKVCEIFAQLRKIPLLCTRFDKEKSLQNKQKFLRKVFIKIS